eukprot:gene7751-8717_t
MNDENENVFHMEEYVKQGISLDGQLPLLLFIAAIMGLGKGGVPGFATVATALTVVTAPTSVVGGLGYAVALQVPILTLIDISAAWLHYRSLDWQTVIILLPLSFVGMYIGQKADKYLTDTSARLLVGTILLAILALRVGSKVMAVLRRIILGQDNAKVLPTTTDDATTTGGGSGDMTNSAGGAGGAGGGSNSYKWAAVVGLVGGAATMLTNSMGPILNVYLLSVRKLSPEEYIGTRAMFFCFINLGKLPMRFASGTLGLQMLPLAAVLGLVSVVGVFCAKPIMLSMKEETFVKLELAVVAFAGARLCWMGFFGA